MRHRKSTTRFDSDFGVNRLGAGGGNRTPRLPIGCGRSTIKLHHPRLGHAIRLPCNRQLKIFPAQQFLSSLFSEDVPTKRIYSLGGSNSLWLPAFTTSSENEGILEKTEWTMLLLTNMFIECL
jgi:hypothetical protein